MAAPPSGTGRFSLTLEERAAQLRKLRGLGALGDSNYARSIQSRSGYGAREALHRDPEEQERIVGGTGPAPGSYDTTISPIFKRRGSRRNLGATFPPTESSERAAAREFIVLRDRTQNDPTARTRQDADDLARANRQEEELTRGRIAATAQGPRRLSSQAITEYPGPGEYTDEPPSPGGGAAIAVSGSSAFASRSSKHIQSPRMGMRETPAPGTYYRIDSAERHRKQKGTKLGKAPLRPKDNTDTPGPGSFRIEGMSHRGMTPAVGTRMGTAPAPVDPRPSFAPNSYPGSNFQLPSVNDPEPTPGPADYTSYRPGSSLHKTLRGMDPEKAAMYKIWA